MRAQSIASFFAAGLVTLASAYTQPSGANVGNPIFTPGLLEAVPANTKYTISWDPTTTGTITLVLLRGPSTNVIPMYAIAENIPNNGAFDWMVPNLEPDTARYGLQIIVDAGGKDKKTGQDAAGQYQWSTQFGVKNPTYNQQSSSTASTTASTSASASASASESSVASTNSVTMSMSDSALITASGPTTRTTTSTSVVVVTGPSPSSSASASATDSSVAVAAVSDAYVSDMASASTTASMQAGNDYMQAAVSASDKPAVTTTMLSTEIVAPAPVATGAAGMVYSNSTGGASASASKPVSLKPSGYAGPTGVGMAKPSAFVGAAVANGASLAGAVVAVAAVVAAL